MNVGFICIPVSISAVGSFLNKVPLFFPFQFPFTFVPSQFLRLLALSNPLYPFKKKKNLLLTIFFSFRTASHWLSPRFITTTDSSAICTSSASLVFRLVQPYFFFQKEDTDLPGLSLSA
jgi:hypothetical protein